MEAEPCLVEWEDAHYDSSADGDPAYIISKSTPTILCTIGWYLGEGEGSIHLAQDLTISPGIGEGDFRGDYRIPKPLVRRVLSLKRGKVIWEKPDGSKVSEGRKAQPVGDKKAVGGRRGRGKGEPHPVRGK